MDTDLVVERVQLLSPKPGEVMFVTVPRDSSPDAAARIGRELRERFPEQTVVVLVGVSIETEPPPFQPDVGLITYIEKGQGDS